MFYLVDVVPELGKVYNESVARNSDEGSCVLGYNIKLSNGVQICPQPFQGSCGCERVYEDVKRAMIEMGYSAESIVTNYGVMD